MKILVCGGRDFNNPELMNNILRDYEDNTTAIIHGNAKGADKLAGEWAKVRGIAVISVDANWDFYNKSAGHVRNYWMLEFCEPDLIIAFPGGGGTAGMVKKARVFGIEVKEIMES